MNDAKIRTSFHSKKLRKHHIASDTLVVDELGLKHGRCRADIAVINGYLIGYEIKSDNDSLYRLADQVTTYSAVFDQASVIVGRGHLKEIMNFLPYWWGVIAALEGQRGAVHFETVRRATLNPAGDDFSVAQLLWRNEAEEELLKQGFSGRLLRQNRSILYRELVEILGAKELRKVVRERLKNRTDWRRSELLFPSDGLCRPCAT